MKGININNSSYTENGRQLDEKSIFHVLKCNPFRKKLKKISILSQDHHQSVGQTEFVVRIKSLGDLLPLQVRTTLIVYTD